MPRLVRILLIAVLVPVGLLLFVVTHEVGHTVLARLLGDPASTFYLVQIDADGEGMCLGCNIYDHTRLSPAGNLIVSLGGLGFTQAAALSALALARRAQARPFGKRLALGIGAGFAFLDVPVQVVQGLLYDITWHTWPTNVDLMDAMLLIGQATGAGQAIMKAALGVAAVVYLYVVWRLAQRIRRAAPA